MLHITNIEVIALALGMATCWILKFSKEKDEYDQRLEAFSTGQWLKSWFVYRWDNILAHVVVSFSALFIGVDNLQAWMGETLNFPDTVDEIGAAFMIGFFGSYLTEILKKAL